MYLLNQPTYLGVNPKYFELTLCPESLILYELILALLLVASFELVFTCVYKVVVYVFKISNDGPMLFVWKRLEHSALIITTKLKTRKVNDKKSEVVFLRYVFGHLTYFHNQLSVVDFGSFGVQSCEYLLLQVNQLPFRTLLKFLDNLESNVNMNLVILHEFLHFGHLPYEFSHLLQIEVFRVHAPAFF